MKRKIIALLLCIVCVVSLCFPVAADDDGYSAIISDIDKTCPTCGATLHASWGSTSGAEVELEISDTGKVKIPSGAGAFARIHLRCSSCGYEKTETRLLGLDFGAEKPGKLVQAPSGIGRKDLPGYADDNGSANINVNGLIAYSVPVAGIETCDWRIDFGVTGNRRFTNNSWHPDVNSIAYEIMASGWDGIRFEVNWMFEAPVTGTYHIYQADFSKDSSHGNISYLESSTSSSTKSCGIGFNRIENRTKNTSNNAYDNDLTLYASKGDSLWFISRNMVSAIWGKCTAGTLIVYVNQLDDSFTKSNNITINNNTWNGNIYTDNSTNLTYIYPQYTTINEKNETVTNISTTPIIYNNETNQYYTYDQTTKNYYYINYEAAPTPTPTPTETPTPSPEPTEEPSPSPTPTPGGSGTGGGDVSTPETGKAGGSSGSSWWDKLRSKIGDAIIDGLLGAVSAVLKLIFKLLSTILSWIIWAVSRVFDLLPFLPPGLGGLLVGGVVVCFVIGIIKFIRG